MKCCPVVAARIVRSESRDGKIVTPTADRLNRKAFCVGDFVAAARFELAFSRAMNPADYHFPTPLCAGLWACGPATQYGHFHPGAARQGLIPAYPTTNGGEVT